MHIVRLSLFVLLPVSALLLVAVSLAVGLIGRVLVSVAVLLLISSPF